MTLARPVQSLKAYSPMDVTSGPMVRLARFAQPPKAYEPMTGTFTSSAVRPVL